MTDFLVNVVLRGCIINENQDSKQKLFLKLRVYLQTVPKKILNVKLQNIFSQIMEEYSVNG
jgi:hypothetical protein